MTIKRMRTKWWYLLSVILPAAMVYGFWFDPPTVFEASHLKLFFYTISVIFPLGMLYIGVLFVRRFIIGYDK